MYADITARVGDTLNFSYAPDPKTYNDVWDMKTLDAYASCDFSMAEFLKNQSGFLYKLTRPGTRYFGCSAQGFHCLVGQKVTVRVLTSPPAAGESLRWVKSSE